MSASTIKDRKSPLKGSRPSVPHGTNFFCLFVVAYENIKWQKGSPIKLLHKQGIVITSAKEVTFSPMSVVCLSVNRNTQKLMTDLCEILWPRAGSGVVGIDPLSFLAACCTRRLNQALSVLSLSLGFF